MEIFQTSQLIDEILKRKARYLEFHRVPSMSCGIYVLPKDGTDPQSPHREDEVYFVLRGRATIRVGSEAREVEPGNLVYVPADVEHRFHGIVEDLSVLVFFAPAEGTASGDSLREGRP